VSVLVPYNFIWTTKGKKKQYRFKTALCSAEYAISPALVLSRQLGTNHKSRIYWDLPSSGM